MVINFIELAATLSRNDGRVTALALQTLVRLHSRQSRSIYFSHDTSKALLEERKRKRKRAREKNAITSANRGPAPHRSSYICCKILFSRIVRDWEFRFDDFAYRRSWFKIVFFWIALSYVGRHLIIGND